MKYEIKEDEWLLIIECYQRVIQKLSPISRSIVSDTLAKIEVDRSLINSEQANAIICLLLADIEDEKEFLEESPKAKRTEIKQNDNNYLHDIITLLNSIRLFFQYYELSPTKNNLTNQHWRS